MLLVDSNWEAIELKVMLELHIIILANSVQGHTVLDNCQFDNVNPCNLAFSPDF